MKSKNTVFLLITLVCSAILALYAIGSLYSDLTGTLISPANATFTSNATIIFNCTAATNLTDIGAGISNITLWLGQQGAVFQYNRTNNSALKSQNGTSYGNVSFAFTQFALAEGLWYWNCKGFNGTTAIAYSQITNNTLVIDLTAPVISFNSSTTATSNNSFINPNLTSQKIIMAIEITELWPANLSYRIFMANGSGPIANFTQSSAGANLYGLSLLSIPVNITATNGSTLVNASQEYDAGDRNAFANAVLVLEANITDLVNNQVTLRRTVTTDSINPLLSITAPFNGTVFKANATSLAIRFNISHADTNLNASRAIYSLGLGGFANNSFTQNTSEIVNTSQTITLSLNATDQQGRNKIIYFITKDKAGREVVNYSSVMLDFAPVITLNKPANAIWSTVTTHLLNFTAINNDTNVSTLDTCQLWGNMVGANASYLMNQSVHADNGTTSTNYVFNGSVSNLTVTLVEGNYTWAIWCNDTTGNSVYSGNRTLYVDTSNPVPTVTATDSRGLAVIALGATVNLGCTATDTVDPNPTTTIDSITLPSGSVVSSPGSSYGAITQTGTYTVACTATDASGRTSSTTTTFVSQYTSLGGSSGGGGGSGTVTVSQSVYVPEITPSNPGIVKLSDAANYALKQIEISVQNAATSVRITVNRLTSKPADAASEAASTAGKVYKYMEVKKTNLDDTNVKSAVVTFQVQKSWITENGAKNQVLLKRLKGSSWETLSTSVTDEDDNYVYYKATSPGLSYFAVVMGEVAEATTTEPVIEEAAKTPETEELAPVPSKMSKKWIWISAIALLVLAAAGAGFYFLKKKRWF